MLKIHYQKVIHILIKIGKNKQSGTVYEGDEKDLIKYHHRLSNTITNTRETSRKRGLPPSNSIDLKMRSKSNKSGAGCPTVRRPSSNSSTARRGLNLQNSKCASINLLIFLLEEDINLMQEAWIGGGRTIKAGITICATAQEPLIETDLEGQTTHQTLR